MKIRWQDLNCWLTIACISVHAGYETDKNRFYWWVIDYTCDFIYIVDILLVKNRVRFINGGLLEVMYLPFHFSIGFIIDRSQRVILIVAFVPKFGEDGGDPQMLYCQSVSALWLYSTLNCLIIFFKRFTSRGSGDAKTLLALSCANEPPSETFTT